VWANIRTLGRARCARHHRIAALARLLSCGERHPLSLKIAIDLLHDRRSPDGLRIIGNADVCEDANQLASINPEYRLGTRRGRIQKPLRRLGSITFIQSFHD
jgi:hypothetical protein